MIFPAYKFVINSDSGSEKIWDIARKKWIILTPEEFIRQHLLHYLVKEKKIPLSMIAVEKQIKLYKRKKRFDIVVFAPSGMPLIVCECKAPEIEISQETVYQIGEYNLVLNAPYLLITNGNQLFFYEITPTGEYMPLDFIDFSF